MMTAIPQPLPDSTASASRARLIHVDALRGFALFGILAVNVWAFADPFYGTGATSMFYDSDVDHVIRTFTSMVFETKFYLLFSFLFGYSFTLQMTSAERTGASFVPRMLRRQITLLLIGLLHGGLLFNGEILSIYAVLGLVLLAARNLKPAWAVGIAAALIVTPCGIFITYGGLEIAGGDVFDTTIVASHPALSAYWNGPLSTLIYHTEYLFQTQLFLWLIQGPSAMAMFFLGYAAGRRQLLVAPYRFQPYERLLLPIALPIGLIGALFYALVETFNPGGGLELLTFGIGELTAPLLATVYAVLMLRWFQTEGGQRLAALLAPMGRMSLSNYILQSIVLGILFTGYGFRLMTELPSWLIVLVVIVTYAMQLWLSTLWMRRHQYGPLEWLLRSVTLMSLPVWRRIA